MLHFHVSAHVTTLQIIYPRLLYLSIQPHSYQTMHTLQLSIFVSYTRLMVVKSTFNFPFFSLKYLQSLFLTFYILHFTSIYYCVIEKRIVYH